MWHILPLAVRSRSIAVSMSFPSVRTRGSTSTAPQANTSTGSSPSSQRAMSKSWMVKSRKSPPEDARKRRSGSPGSRLVMISCSSLPIAPASRRFFRSRKLGSKRRLKPTNIGTRAFLTSLMHRSTFGSVRSTGFSQKMALPARAAAIERSAWLPVDEAIRTAWTWGSENASSAAACLAPSGSASARAASGLVSTTWTSLASLRCARFSACMRPMRPAPNRAKLTNADCLLFLVRLQSGFCENQGLAAVLRADRHGRLLRQGTDECGHLGAIGIRVALEEEIERPVGDRAARAEMLDRGLAEILRAQHASSAEHLDALVVAIRRAARIVDVAHPV